MPNNCKVTKVICQAFVLFRAYNFKKLRNKKKMGSLLENCTEKKSVALTSKKKGMFIYFIYGLKIYYHLNFQGFRDKYSKNYVFLAFCVNLVNGWFPVNKIHKAFFSRTMWGHLFSKNNSNCYFNLLIVNSNCYKLNTYLELLK